MIAATAPACAASWRAIGTHVGLVVTDPATLPLGRAMLAGGLDDLDRVASRFRSDSELGAINRLSAAAAARGEESVSVRLSEDLSMLLARAFDAERITSGLVTPTIGRALVAAGYDADLDVVRRRVTAGPVSAATGAHLHSHSCLVNGMLTLTSGTIMDLGAIAKACAAQRYAEQIAAAIDGGVLVDLGGDIASAGMPPAGGWRVRVGDWAGRTRQVVSASHNQAFATSSTRVRTWHTDHSIAHHIIDPRTGRPALTRWAQVTCVSVDAVLANAACTAAVILDGGAPQWLSDRGIPALLIGHDGAEIRVGGWPESTSKPGEGHDGQ